MLSNYYFHCDEELLAWRTIGVAARMALKMGLHRKRSLLDNYKTPEDWAKAVRTFWCVYALDRRWSFGTGLLFALNDRDIDPELPQPKLQKILSMSLVDLAETSDIYVRQQAAFNYFLLSALAVVLLAVCNAPDVFWESCRDSFSTSIALVRGFSRQSHASKRLWRSIRGLLPAVKALGLKVQRGDAKEGCERRAKDGRAAVRQSIDSSDRMGGGASTVQDGPPHDVAFDMALGQVIANPSPDADSTLPDIYQMSNDLMGLFDAFGEARTGSVMMEPMESFLPDQTYMSPGYPAEISRRFQDLIWKYN
ncbi:hypothetical protein DL769_004883 [Monosporascus sp. CRB-8-3]|nr:hypothetical protein DL769_004883 [Monosporascus sp. CRB-8-3]